MSAGAELVAYLANQDKDELLEFGTFKPRRGAGIREMTWRIACAVLTYGDFMGRDWTGWRLVVAPAGHHDITTGGYIEMETLRRKVQERLQD
ncbi:MAG: hypothetical protein OXE96_16265 [Gemmatimonadetes bacterium]|nr:hypothetical protein [Gemmatimonadota bacterium]